MDEQQKKIAKKILRTLEGERFARWYQWGRTDGFDYYVSGMPEAKTKEQILSDIVRLFNL